MPELPNYYEALGVRPDADAATIKRAYYERMRRHHPDNFLAERKRLEIVGDKQALKRIDETIKQAQQRTQVINAAYNVLSDPERRKDYDWLRSKYAPSPASAPASPASPDDEYDSRRHRRPHSRPTPTGRHPLNASPERFPAVLAVGFLIVLGLSLAFVSNFLYSPPARVRNGPPTVNIPAGSVDATARASRRPATPRAPESYIVSGDALYNAALYTNAVDEYTHAIEKRIVTAEVYYKRGRSYAALESYDKALADFDQAVQLDESLVEIYYARGLVYYAQWQHSSSDSDADNARQNLAEYARRGGDMSQPEIVAAQQALQD